MKYILYFIILITTNQAIAGDSLYLKVHFLYGSRPKAAYKDTEAKWFGGKLGGHVGIEADSTQILNFVPTGKHHAFAKNKTPQSAFVIHNPQSFYAILGGNGSNVKKAIIYIPISDILKLKMDSISAAYRQESPYDYAIFGMRCGAAAYDILAQLGILPEYSIHKTYKKIFYPKKLRKRLFRLADKNHWFIYTEPGSNTRKWETN